ncbi:Crp/Fnr family transcriptional regulator [Streptomyces sp. MN03-5084-2B]|nr:Crp/Fnr family transcriptional regulator [Streptomyces sp. MN03-5084-2B]
MRSSPRLSSEAFAQLVKIGNQKSYAAGSEILLEGQDVTHVSLVETGIVKLLCRTVDGSSVLQGVLGPGDIVGLESIDGQGSMFSAYSVVDLNVTAIDFEAFTDALSGSKKLSLEIAKQISGRLREASRRRLDFSAYDVHLRVLRVLRELSDRFGEIQSDGSVVIRLGLSQGQIGQLVGAGEASVGRAIRLLREKGLLETGMRSMVLRKRALDFDVNVE